MKAPKTKAKITLTSVIIPCRNEEKFIAKCLNSIILQNFPKKKLEVLVVDGMSEDRTREILKRYQKDYSFIKVLDNPKKITPCALNIGIKNSKGEVIIRMDAHAAYKKDYISKCLKYLREYKADNVGGVMKTIPAKNTLMAKAITISLSHPFGQVGSYFRIGVKKPKLVDTVFGGCYKKEVFKKIGLFNENLIKSQDMEFNLRLKRRGGKILLMPDIISYYYPKDNLKDFLFHNFKDGFWSIYSSKFTKKSLSVRHYIPLVFVIGLLISGIFGFFLPIFQYLFLFGACLYILFNLYFSMATAAQKKNFKLIFSLPLVFTIRHIGYGLGSFYGLIKLIG